VEEVWGRDLRDRIFGPEIAFPRVRRPESDQFCGLESEREGGECTGLMG
jgi:hypothetical protein